MVVHTLLLTFVVTCKIVVARDDNPCINEGDRIKMLLKGEPNCGDTQCHCDSEGTTARCVAKSSSSVLPMLNTSIVNLYAHCYHLSQLDRSLLKNISNLDLRALHLRSNKINNVSKDVFKQFHGLSVLEISDSMGLDQRMIIPTVENVKAPYLNLTLNRMGIDSLKLFSMQHVNMSMIKYLSLQENRIEELNVCSITQLKCLDTLRLNKNWIKNITTELGCSLPQLKTLDLDGNQIKRQGLNFCNSKAETSTSLFPNLRELKLSHNLIGKGKIISSKWTCLKTLLKLDLSHNRITKLDMALLANLTELREVNLMSNWIQTIAPGQYPPMLEVINLRNNEFVANPPKLCVENSNDIFPNVKVLNFSRNYIQNIITDQWKCLPNIETLDFSKNDIHLLRNNTFANFTNLKQLYLDNMIPLIKTIEPVAFNSSTLQVLSLSFNWIDFTNSDFQSIFNWCPNVHILDVSYNFFETLREETVARILAPMTNLKNLTAQRISLKNFPSSFLTLFKHLQYLNINRNRLATLEFSNAFNDPTMNLSIKHISVAEGDIKVVNESAFPAAIENSLAELDLSGNEFDCDCEMQWFRDQIKDERIGKIRLLKWPEKYICRSPQSLIGKPFQNYRPDKNCNPWSNLFVALISGACSFVIFIALFGITYRNRWYLQYFWYKFRRSRKHFTDDTERQPLVNHIMYDGFIVYHSADGNFVHHEFRRLMENELHYKVHIWERDANNGTLVDVMLDAMYASKDIVVIVSEHSMNDHWCKFQVDVALDRSIQLKRNCVLLIVLENIDYKYITKTWCMLLTKNTTAEWHDSGDENNIKRKLLKQTICKHFGISMRNNTFEE